MDYTFNIKRKLAKHHKPANTAARSIMDANFPHIQARQTFVGHDHTLTSKLSFVNYLQLKKYQDANHHVLSRNRTKYMARQQRSKLAADTPVAPDQLFNVAKPADHAIV